VTAAFTETEMVCLRHLARTLLPSDEDPGADELGVAEVIAQKTEALLAAFRERAAAATTNTGGQP
jgi:hypothetical protein